MKVDRDFLNSALSAEKRDLFAQLLREEGIQPPDAGAKDPFRFCRKSSLP